MMFLMQLFSVWQSTFTWLLGLTLVFAGLSFITPCNPGMYWWKDKRAVVTDMVYWLFVPLFLRVFRIMMLYTGAAFLIGADKPAELDAFFREGYGPLKDLPLWLQCILILLISDVYLYWVHRGFHRPFGWRFHAVHHSPKVLDWMSTQRFHPVNNLLAFSVADTLMMLIGFSPQALVALAPFNVIFSAFVHANLNWKLGPLQYVIATPVFHRWHHTGVKEGGSRNFAPTFPILDIMFGTYYMPKDKLPSDYGVSDPHFPRGFWAQFMYPFRRAR